MTVAADVVAANVKGNKVLLHSQNPLSGGQPLVGQLKQAGRHLRDRRSTSGPAACRWRRGDHAVPDQDRQGRLPQQRQEAGDRLGNCKDKTQDFRARFTDNQGQLAVGTDTYKCKRKG